MTFPDDETGQVLTEMQAAGINLAEMHKVVFFQLFEQELQAKAMIEHLAAQAPDMLVTIEPDELPNVWDVNCTVTMIPSYEAIVAQEAEFELLATKFNGFNDGWGIEA
tara:strand:+ start:245 stop:568 length:324 start_codon:yes stop_codon:yes gene_type:complete